MSVKKKHPGLVIFWSTTRLAVYFFGESKEQGQDFFDFYDWWISHRKINPNYAHALFQVSHEIIRNFCEHANNRGVIKISCDDGVLKFFAQSTSKEFLNIGEISKIGFSTAPPDSKCNFGIGMEHIKQWGGMLWGENFKIIGGYGLTYRAGM